jgi:hypothetical protein
MAALRIVAKGGFIPQAKHGGKGVEAVAVVGSKFEGTGLENEHIGHTQVTVTGVRDGDAPREANGLTLCNTGEGDCVGKARAG